MHFGFELNQITEALFQCFIWKQFSFSMLADYAVFNSCWRDDWWKEFSLWVCFQVQTELWHSNPVFLTLISPEAVGKWSVKLCAALFPQTQLQCSSWDPRLQCMGWLCGFSACILKWWRDWRGKKKPQNSEQESVEDGGSTWQLVLKKDFRIRHPEPG